MECLDCGRELIEDAAYCPACGARNHAVPEREDYAYEAFISYRHLPRDKAVARKLQKFLEGFRIPKRLQANGGNSGGIASESARGLPVRLGKLFRDEDELPVSDSLPDQITEALKRSRFLIVVCTPQTRESTWVMKEVESFASYHGRRKVLVALADGSSSESLPPLLINRIVKQDDGELVEVSAEPLAADLREGSRKRLSDELLRLAAPLIGCEYDDLRQRMRIRRTRLAAGIAAAVTALSLSFGGFSYYQQVQIQDNYRQVQIQESELLAAEAQALLEQGDRYQAIQVALDALPDSSTSDDRPFVPSAQLVLNRAIGAYPSSNLWIANHSIALSSDAPCAIANFNAVATVCGNGDIELYEAFWGSRILTVKKSDLLGDGDSPNTPCNGLGFCNRGLVCSYGRDVFCIDVSTGKTAWHVKGETIAMEVITMGDAVSVLFECPDPSDATSRSTVNLYDAADGALLHSYRSDHLGGVETYSFLADEGESLVALEAGGSGRVSLFDAEGNETRIDVEGEMMHGMCVGKGSVYISSGVASLFGHVTIEAFDLETAERKWVHKEDVLYGYDLTANVDAVNNRILFAEETGTLFVTVSSKVVELDAETGRVVNSRVLDKPILDLAHYESLIFGILSDGQLFGLSSSQFSSNMLFSEDLTTNDLTDAKIVPCPGVGVLGVGRSIAPSKLTVFSLGNGFVADLSDDKADWIADGSDVYWDNGLPCALSSDGVHFLDSETFREQGMVVKEELSLLDWEGPTYIAHAQEGSVYVWGKASEDASDIAVYRVSKEGEVFDAAVLKGALDEPGEPFEGILASKRLTATPDGNVLFFSCRRAMILDGENLDVLQELPVDSTERIDFAFAGEDNLLLLVHTVTREATSGRFLLIDRTSGEALSSDLDSCSFYVAAPLFSDFRTGFYRTYASKGFAAAIDSDSQRVALSCADGAIRVFSMMDGSLIWESWEMQAFPLYVGFIPQSDNLLVQDEQGRCSLVSGQSGAVISSTTTILPPIQRCVASNGDTMLVSYREIGAVHRPGLALVSTDERAFGPYTDIPHAVCVSQSLNSALTEDGNSFLIYPVLSLDMSISLADTLLEEHSDTGPEGSPHQ